MPNAPSRNTLFYGDNLPILREYFPAACMDLVYLDPPFNSNRSYNVLFQDESGVDSDAQIQAFDDTWHWGAVAERVYTDLVQAAPDRVSRMVGALRDFVGTNQMLAYLVMMAARLVELHRVLKPTGSLYLHCDPTASHYLKIILDAIFGPENFRNEIIWERTSSHNDTRRWMHIHDVLLFYSKSRKFTWNPVFTEHDPKYVENFYRYSDERGVYRLDHIIRSATMGPRPNLAYEYKGYTPEWGWRVNRIKLEELDADDRLAWSKSGRPYLKRYLDEQSGVPIKSIIADIPPISSQAKERLGYPTQKPLALLERIIQASSNPGDWVLDPFCGCGTAVVAAQQLERQWVGIDVTHLSIALQKNRLKDMFELAAGRDYAVIGEPQSLGAARQLAQEDRFQFQFWALSLIGARPLGAQAGSKQGKRGADRGIDGVITFIDEATAKPKRALVQVKSGQVKSGDIRDLRGTVEREGAALGLFITLEPPSREMETEAVSAGYYTSPGWGKDYPRLQILTIAALLGGAQPQLPPSQSTFKVAQKAAPGAEQRELGF